MPEPVSRTKGLQLKRRIAVSIGLGTIVRRSKRASETIIGASIGLVVTGAFFGASPAAFAKAPPFSHAALDTVLQRHLRGGLVDYGALARDPAPLTRYLESTLSAEPDTWTRAEQIAFWVNVYNARVLDGVIRRPGLESVLDVDKLIVIPTLGFFRESFRVAGCDLSLNDIEHKILRERYDEPRIHFVLNCASLSCPLLPERPLAADSLDVLLERATRAFLTDRQRNRIDPAKELELSAIFNWYDDDFNAAEGSIQTFIEKHWPDDAPFAPKLPVRFLDYDWSLNGHW